MTDWLAVILSAGIPLVVVLGVLLLRLRKAPDSSSPPSPAQTSAVPVSVPAADGPGLVSRNTSSRASDVGDFYDRSTADFVKVYGEVIQAFRTRNLDHLLDYQIAAMGLEKGMTAIDAGCGVGGPAVYFAGKTGARIRALTISGVQAEEARKRVAAKGLEALVEVVQGDYHALEAYFEPGGADLVYFLESFGHSHDKAAAIDSAWRALKPGGRLYIKDLFLKEPLKAADAPLMQREVDRIDAAYHYHIADLYAVLRHLRKSGWILAQLKTIDLPLEDFENLSISNEFQDLTGIGRIDSWEDYIFPVEFYELVCIKPWTDPSLGNQRYFLQNLYYMQVLGKSAEEIGEMRVEG